MKRILRYIILVSFFIIVSPGKTFAQGLKSLRCLYQEGETLYQVVGTYDKKFVVSDGFKYEPSINYDKLREDYPLVSPDGEERLTAGEIITRFYPARPMKYYLPLIKKCFTPRELKILRDKKVWVITIPIVDADGKILSYSSFTVEAHAPDIHFVEDVKPRKGCVRVYSFIKLIEVFKTHFLYETLGNMQRYDINYLKNDDFLNVFFYEPGLRVESYLYQSVDLIATDKWESLGWELRYSEPHSGPDIPVFNHHLWWEDFPR